MMIKQAIINTAYSVISKSTSVLYESTNGLFDPVIKEMDGQLFDSKDILENYYYDCYFSNNIFTNNNMKDFIFTNHLKSVIGIHSEPPHSFKKEDLYIFHSNTKYSTKIFFGDDIAASWRVDNSVNNFIIDYGIPRFNSKVPRDVPVLILNLDNNPQIDNLYRFIQSNIDNCIMIKSISGLSSLQEIVDVISKSKIVIDTSSRINILFALACGCNTISSLKSIKSSFNYPIEDYSSVMTLINTILLDYNKDISENIKEEIATNYPYDTFLAKINSIFTNYIKHQEIFKL